MSAHSSPMLTTDPLHAKTKTQAPPHEVAPGVLLHAAFVNSYAVDTGDGLLLIDPGLGFNAPGLHAAVREWSTAPLRTAVYTHGHADHAFGLGPFLEAGEHPEIVAQEDCPRRFERYRKTHRWNALLNQRQFNTPAPVFPSTFHWPTILVHDALVQRIGNLEVRYRAEKGETDDHLTVWIPERSFLFTGDLIIWVSPNCGNPQKVQRYPLEWAEALERMASLDAEWLFPGHGLVVHGRDAVRMVLTDTARWLRVLVEQVLERMNAGETPEAIVHAVAPDPELSTRPYLQPLYDHPKFVVRNLLRLWGGWWSGNPADLLPATWERQAEEIVALAGGVAAVVARGRALLESGESVLAAHLAEWAARGTPGDRDALVLVRDVYARRLAEERSLMAQGIYRAAMNDARRALGEEIETAFHGLSLGGE